MTLWAEEFDRRYSLFEAPIGVYFVHHACLTECPAFGLIHNAKIRLGSRAAITSRFQTDPLPDVGAYSDRLEVLWSDQGNAMMFRLWHSQN
jgi:hypothetical protein